MTNCSRDAWPSGSFSKEYFVVQSKIADDYNTNLCFNCLNKKVFSVLNNLNY